MENSQENSMDFLMADFMQQEEQELECMLSKDEAKQEVIWKVGILRWGINNNKCNLPFLPDELWNIIHRETVKSEKEQNIKDVCASIDVMVKKLRTEFIMYDSKTIDGPLSDFMESECCDKLRFYAAVYDDPVGLCNKYEMNDYYLYTCKKNAVIDYVALSTILPDIRSGLSTKENKCIAQFRKISKLAKDRITNDYESYYEEKLVELKQ